MMVAHSDASFKQGHVGIGFKLYRPPTSTPHGKGHTRLSHMLFTKNELEVEFTSEMAEYRAVIETVREAVKYDVDTLVLITDCKPVVEKIRRRETITEGARFRDELYQYLEQFDYWQVKHKKRDRNVDAHKQAAKAIKRAPISP